MMKPLLLGLLLAALPTSAILAQGAASSPAAGGKKAEAAKTPQGPTTIDSSSMDYDEKTRIAIFTGDDYGVTVKDPSFTVYCDKLTAHMRKAAAPAPAIPGAKPTPKGKATPAASASPSPRGNGLQSALAEGSADRPVVILQDKPAANGEAAQRNVGISLKADYNADTGDVILTGWPRVTQGINTQIATAPYTVMTMNRDGHTMKTHGPSRTVIQEQDQPKKTGTDAASSPTPSSQ